MTAADEVLVRAGRLARAIASDIAVYHPEAVAKGVADDTFFELLAPQLDEVLALYRSRVGASVDVAGQHFWQAVVEVMLTGMGHIASPMW